MKTHLQCIPCTLNSFLRLADSGVIPEDRQEALLRSVTRYLSEVEYTLSPPALGREIQRRIRAELQDPDPYRDIKLTYNRMMLEREDELRALIRDAEEPFLAAMRLAVGGNVIDFGARHLYDVTVTLRRALDVELAIDDSAQLRQALTRADSVMYIGDNCGEIVLDKLFLEQIDVPRKVFVVRESPVLNDITRDDAAQVGLDPATVVLSTGDDSPGAVWEYASEEFREHFARADVVIAKGQGNLEGLLDVGHDQIYHLLMTKCDLIAQAIGTTLGAYVVKKGKTKRDV